MFATKSSGFCVAQSKIFQLMSTDDLQTHELIEAHTFTNMYCLCRWFKVFFAFFMRFNADIVFKRDLLVAFQRCTFRIHMKDSHMNHLINKFSPGTWWQSFLQFAIGWFFQIFTMEKNGWLEKSPSAIHLKKTWFFAFSGVLSVNSYGRYVLAPLKKSNFFAKAKRKSEARDSAATSGERRRAWHRRWGLSEKEIRDQRKPVEGGW